MCIFCFSFITDQDICVCFSLFLLNDFVTTVLYCTVQMFRYPFVLSYFDFSFDIGNVGMYNEISNEYVVHIACEANRSFSLLVCLSFFLSFLVFMFTVKGHAEGA